MYTVRRLIFDADDTLWENNLYYIQAEQAFYQICSEARIDHKLAANDFSRLELSVVNEMGYGSQNYIYILKTLFQRYDQLRNNSHLRKKFEKIISNFQNHLKTVPPIFPDVIPTLEFLKNKYELFVLTKGDINEQKGKLKRSKLLPHFKEVFVETEKNFQTYQAILKEKEWQPESVCMIGNSPKSDINPALALGMYAVYIPYPYTWKLDHEQLNADQQRLKIISKFADLISLLDNPN